MSSHAQCAKPYPHIQLLIVWNLISQVFTAIFMKLDFFILESPVMQNLQPVIGTGKYLVYW